MRIFHFLTFILLTCLISCSDSENSGLNIQNSSGEYIYRTHNEFSFNVPPPEIHQPEAYPWEKKQVGNFPKITKDFFRCKGSHLNPPRIIDEKGQALRHYDCGGSEKHSLPLRDQKEFIYPILMDLVNYIQIKTGKKVIITAGHRCPEHNTYNDPSPANQYSKHMMGAEVSFYVQGLEEKAETLPPLIQTYYSEAAKYKDLKDRKNYTEFQRYDKESDVVTPPWFNKEIFIKLYKKKEGRNFDNRHPYAYISIQVRFDAELQEKVTYSWDKAFRNYLRR